jgi:TRAP-type transport system periplasmic protein
MNRRMAIVLVAATAISLGGIANAGAATTLRIGFATALDGPAGDGIKKMAEIVKERTNGEVELEIFPGAQLGGEVEMLTQVRSGNLDLAMIGSGVTASLEPSFFVTELPFIWKSSDSFWQVLNGPVGQELLDKLESKGVKALGWGTWGYRGLINTGYEINKPEDLEGKRIRVAQSDLYVKTVQAFGGNPVPVSWTEVYTALQQNAVDSIETSYFAFVEAKLYEVATSLAVTNHILSGTVIMMNGPKFNALTPEQQQILVDAAREGGNTMRESVNKANDDAIAFIGDKGLTVTHPDPAPFTALVEPVHAFFAPKVGEDIIAKIKAAQ